jgi:hypothetical protein
MTVASTSTLSGSVSGFDDICRLTQRARLVRWLFVSQRFTCFQVPFHLAVEPSSSGEQFF